LGILRAQRTIKMSLYKLYEWESNGYQDSDWYASIYDSINNDIFVKQTGTTRFANSLPDGCIYEMLPSGEWNKIKLQIPDQNIINKAWEILVKKRFVYFQEKQKNDQVNFTVSQFQKGTEVFLREPHKNYEKDEVTCHKCQGSGKWINPKQVKDIRECFACLGMGTICKAKSANKKWKIIVPGTTGIIVELFRYSRLESLSSISAKIKSENFIFNASLSKLGVHIPILSDKELMDKAKNIPKDLSSFYWIPRN
jgi:hypothetical protein